MIGNASGLTRTKLIYEELLHGRNSQEEKKAWEIFRGLKNKEEHFKFSGTKDVVIDDYKIRAEIGEEDDWAHDYDHVHIISLTHLKKDFSDSDKMFAKNAGIKYLDIEEFDKNGVD